MVSTMAALVLVARAHIPSAPDASCGSITEGFDDITTLGGAGWVQLNHSMPIGTTGWGQGNDAVFPSHAGAPNSYIFANFRNTTGTNTISNWLLTPAVTLQNGVTMTFWTRTTTESPFPDRLQVRMSTNGASQNVGVTATDVGDFTSLLLDINPTYTVGGYPEVYTQMTVTVTGVPSATLGRLAFRYFVEDGGDGFINSNYIGIDTFQFNGACVGGTPTPSPTATATPGGTPNPTATPSKNPAPLLNISTRLRIQTGDNALIGGFILAGTDPKRVIVRAIGPSLSASGVQGALADTTLELRDGSGQLLAQNDNWRTGGQAAEIIATTIPPANDLESAIVMTLPANNAGYTAIVRGANDTTGIGLVEVYDLGQGANSQLANISTRGFVETGDNAMIGGFILGGSAGASSRVVVRAIGPSLGAAGVAGALADPTLELKDGNGSTLLSNDDWQQTQAAEINGTGLAPTNIHESALLISLPPGSYTAIVRGVGNTTGVGLVEVYNLQ
jgi:hypothetical protein